MPKINTSRANDSWPAVADALASVLIPLPYLLVAAAATTLIGVRTATSPSAEPLSPMQKLRQDIMEDHGQSGYLNLKEVPLNDSASALMACILTSGTLLLVGVFGVWRTTQQRLLDRRKLRINSTWSDSQQKQQQQQSSRLWTLQTAQTAAARTLGVGLPFYAALQIGGTRTSMLLLTAVATGLIYTNGHISSVAVLAQTVQARRATFFVLALCIIGDLSGLTSTNPSSGLILGYSALFCAVFIFPPPLPSIPDASSAAKSEGEPAGTTTTGAARPMGNSNRLPASSLTRSPHDSQLTLLSGVATTSLTVLFCLVKLSFGHVMPLLSGPWLVLTLASCIATAASMLYSRPFVFFPQRAYDSHKHRPWKTSLYIIAPAAAIIAFAMPLFTPITADSPTITFLNLFLLISSCIGYCYDKIKPSFRLHRSSNDANGSANFALSPNAFSSAMSPSILSPFPFSSAFSFASPPVSPMVDGRPHHHHHDHDHDHHHHGPTTAFRRKSSAAATILQLIDGEDCSFVTRFLMARCQPGSLMAGILAEKDSRRIAYFTM
jgi:zinc transporter 5/7